jgi:ArsR family transcriptional regulator
MESRDVIAALEALAQENRLAIFRRLVVAGMNGLTPGEIGEALDIPAPTLSFHLAQLRHAGLVNVERNGRSLSYSAAYAAMNDLIAFLTENCCGGTECLPAAGCKPTSSTKEKSHEASARPRRRA